MTPLNLSAALRFCREIDQLKTPAAVFAELQKVSAPHVSYGAAWYVPKSASDFSALVLGRTLFISEQLPVAAIWREFMSLTAEHGGTGLAEYGRRQSAPFTLAEARRALRPAGREDWIFRLLQRHGIRDGIYCPFRHWTLGYWSGKVLDRLPPDARDVLFMAAASAVRRLEKLVKNPQRLEATDWHLTDRELSCLRLASYGKSLNEIAAHLQIAPSTVRTHLQKASRKLKAKNRYHAIAEAFRHGLLK